MKEEPYTRCESDEDELGNNSDQIDKEDVN